MARQCDVSEHRWAPLKVIKYTPNLSIKFSNKLFLLNCHPFLIRCGMEESEEAAPTETVRRSRPHLRRLKSAVHPWWRHRVEVLGVLHRSMIDDRCCIGCTRAKRPCATLPKCSANLSNIFNWSQVSTTHSSTMIAGFANWRDSNWTTQDAYKGGRYWFFGVTWHLTKRFDHFKIKRAAMRRDLATLRFN